MNGFEEPLRRKGAEKESSGSPRLCVSAVQNGEALARKRFITEARTWLGTPFRDQADVKGGGVDCAMLLVRAAVDAGLVPPFDPRPYPPQWHLHRDEERFLAIVGKLGSEIRREPIAGDVIVYRVGRCFSHGGIIIEDDHVLHAYYKTQSVVISPLHESELAFLPEGKPRPFKLFDLWAKKISRGDTEPQGSAE